MASTQAAASATSPAVISRSRDDWPGWIWLSTVEPASRA
jgi:hypothetical protein